MQTLWCVFQMFLFGFLATAGHYAYRATSVWVSNSWEQYNTLKLLPGFLGRFFYWDGNIQRWTRWPRYK